MRGMRFLLTLPRLLLKQRMARANAPATKDGSIRSLRQRQYHQLQRTLAEEAHFDSDVSNSCF